MEDKQLKVLQVGIGFHANRIYLPIIKHLEKELKIKLCAVIDLIMENKICKKRLNDSGFSNVKQIFLENSNHREAEKIEILKLIRQENINTIIISCPPIYHKFYILIALENNLNILVDKPITMRSNSSNSPENAVGIWEDFCEIKKIYLEKLNKDNNLVFSCLAQRRYHPAFQLIQELIEDVYQKTSFSPNSITTNYSDGQWRLPEEILNEKYHGFNEGVGMLSHSGHHFFDSAILFSSKKIIESNTFEVFSNASYPKDNLYNFGVSKYKKIFPSILIYSK